MYCSLTEYLLEIVLFLVRKFRYKYYVQMWYLLLRSKNGSQSKELNVCGRTAASQ
jgi:hypothetical protein